MRSDLFVGSATSPTQLVLGVAVLAVLGGVVVASSSIEPWCPAGWTRIDDRCISLQHRPRTPIEAARHCEDEDNGRLVSVEGEALAGHLGAYLMRADPTRSVWVTSGRRRANSTDSFEWLSSGQRLTYDLWAPDNGREGTAGRDVIALVHIDGQYKLTTVPSTDKYSFICETTPFGARLFAHRQSFLTSGAAPSILLGPHDVFHYQDYLPDKLVVLQCHAIGTPTPLIRWFKSGVELPLSRAIIATGSLVLNISGASDYDSYHCTASNYLGTARSVSAFVRAGFVDNFAPSRLDVFVVEGSGAKIDCHEPDHYPKTLSFSWMLGGSTNNFVPQSGRVFVSRDGMLLFSFVKAEDANSYACTVSNSHTQSGHYGPFFRLVVTARPAPVLSIAAPRIDANFLKVFPSKPQFGHDAFLECFAYGRPSPTYSWSKVDGHLANNSIVSNFGRVLKLSSLTKEQAGVYRCTASNPHGEVTADVTISLQRAPVFLKSLVDRSVPINSTVRLRCETLAVPPANTEWFKDGTPISPLLMSSADHRRYTVNDSMLTIMPAFEADSAMYQCIATNAAGSASSSARLFVQNFPPTIDRNFVRIKHVAFEGSSLTISCANHASPKAAVTWHHSGLVVDDRGRLHRSKNGSLVIDDVLDTDAGEYACIASNLLGFDSITVALIVIAKPSVRLEPNEIYIPQNADAMLSCKIDSKCSANCPEMQHDWTFNALPLSSLHPFANIRPTTIGKFALESQISLPSTMGNNRIGRFVCSTIAGAEAADVKLFPVPLAPIRTTISEIGATWVRLSWQQPRDFADTTIDGYLVEYRTKNDLKWRPLPAGRVMVSTRQVKEFQLDDIFPNTRYQFRVKTRGANGFGEPSAPTDWQTTRAIRPTEQVSAIRFWSVNSNDLMIEWDPLLRINHNGPNLRYVVLWADNVHMKDNQSLTTVAANVTLRMQRSTARDCQFVYITVQPINDLGFGPVSRPIRATLSNEGVTRVATNVSASSINATHAKLSWGWKEFSSCDDSIISEIKCVTNTEKSIASMVPVEQTSVVLSDLNVATQYDCNVVAINRKGRRGADSERISFTTLESPPEFSPSIVRLYPEGSDSARLEWSPVPLDMLAINKSQGYQIEILEGETSRRILSLHIPLKDLSDLQRPAVILNGLKQMRLYRLSVVAFNSGGYGPKSEQFSMRIGSLRPSSGIRSHPFGASTSLLLFVIVLFLNKRSYL